MGDCCLPCMVVLFLVEEGGATAVLVGLCWVQVCADVCVSLLVGHFHVLCVLVWLPLPRLYTQHAPVAVLQRGTLLIEEQAAGADCKHTQNNSTVITRSCVGATMCRTCSCIFFFFTSLTSLTSSKTTMLVCFANSNLC